MRLSRKFVNELFPNWIKNKYVLKRNKMIIYYCKSIKARHYRICKSLKTVRWSSNLPTRVNTTDYYSSVFDSCSNLETIENYPTATGSIVPASNWKSCSKLDIYQFYPLL